MKKLYDSSVNSLKDCCKMLSFITYYKEVSNFYNDEIKRISKEELKTYKKQLRVNLLSVISNEDIFLSDDLNNFYEYLFLDTVCDTDVDVIGGYLSLNRTIKYLVEKNLVVTDAFGCYQVTDKGNRYIESQMVRKRSN